MSLDRTALSARAFDTVVCQFGLMFFPDAGTRGHRAEIGLKRRE